MNGLPDKCEFCQKPVTRRTIRDGAAEEFSGCDCGCYRRPVEHSFSSFDEPTCQKIGALLFERRLRRQLLPIAFASDPGRVTLEGFVSLRPDELLDKWPAGVPETIERCFLNVCHLSRHPGDTIEFVPPIQNQFLVFTTKADEQEFYIKALSDGGLIEFPAGRLSGSPNCSFQVTPKGWMRCQEMSRRSTALRNPAFVAMWFGEQKRREEMTDLYRNALERAARRAGYNVTRGDSAEHNDPVMDRVVADIRRAPFVIAELTENSRGVYYEAGFARGIGTPVIYCVPEGVEPHFDVTGINHVRWSTPEELCKKLYDRILGSIGRGPLEEGNHT